MIIREGQIWIYTAIDPRSRPSTITNKFYSIIAIDAANLECNYGPNDCSWVKSKLYDIDNFHEIVKARLAHGYVLTDDYELNIEKYREAKIKLEKLSEIMPFNGPDQKIMRYNLLKNGKMSVSDMIMANQYWDRRKVMIGT